MILNGILKVLVDKALSLRGPFERLIAQRAIQMHFTMSLIFLDFIKYTPVILRLTFFTVIYWNLQINCGIIHDND